jgi:hypothetical protein
VEQIKRKEGSRRLRKIIDKEVIKLIGPYTLNKIQRKKFGILCLKKRASLTSTVERLRRIYALVAFAGGNL